MFRMSRIVGSALLILTIVLSGCTLPTTKTSDDNVARNTPDSPTPSTPTKANGRTPEQTIATKSAISSDPTKASGGNVEQNIPTKSPVPSNPTKASNTQVPQNPGGSMPAGAAEKIEDWWGVIKKTQPGAQYDDYFERRDLGQIIYFGIDSMNPAVQAQIKSLRDSGKVVHLYGTLLSNVPDYNGSQIQVERIEIEN
jgi:hypothetical protein